MYFTSSYTRFSCSGDILLRILLIFLIMNITPLFGLYFQIFPVSIGTLKISTHVETFSNPLRHADALSIIDYLYSLSYRSVILQSSAIAIFSRWQSLGDVWLVSTFCKYDLLRPVFLANCISVKFFFVRASHVSISMSAFLLSVVFALNRTKNASFHFFCKKGVLYRTFFHNCCPPDIKNPYGKVLIINKLLRFSIKK